MNQPESTFEISLDEHPDVSVYVVFEGTSLDPDEITRRTGIVPSRTWMKGDYLGRSPVIRRSNGWRVSSKLDASHVMDEHVTNILETLEPGWSSLKDIATSCSVGLQVVIIDVRDYVPSIHLDTLHVHRLSELGAWVDVDVMGWGGES